MNRENISKIIRNKLIDLKCFYPFDVPFTQKEQFILNMRKEGKTYAEIGESLKVSRSRIEQKYKSTIKRLEFQEKILNPLLDELEKYLSKKDQNDGMESTRYWRIAPGQGGFLWAEQRDNNCIAVGWNDTENLNRFKNKEDFQKQFLKIYGEKRKKAANELWRFYRDIKEGDKILANSGRQIFGIGTVVKGGYRFDKNLFYSHSQLVNWDLKFWTPADAEKIGLPIKLLKRIRAILTISELKLNDWEIIKEKLEKINNPFKTISEFEGLSHAPRTEQEAIVLFSKLSRLWLKMKIESVGTQFPDAIIKVKEGDVWQTKSAEFELYSSGFKSHMEDYKKDPKRCDMIICWEDDWKGKPKNLEVVELKKELEKII